ncbi:Aste57867_24807 [Aphanomyces stellatus]|uniref:Aste57867_24807 protein n=1 Tax=Aphanomyces stellatus TaxID=120398 RepID=A0A485LRE8_9STRA|nr:hypothetical protein As57867_024729 [Aphanomyces stellatus]VFU01442.1 Aste57867_24807 [Aphanomyces stellatus]
MRERPASSSDVMMRSASRVHLCILFALFSGRLPMIAAIDDANLLPDIPDPKSILSTVWGNVTGRGKAVSETTFTTDCTNASFASPDGWLPCANESLTCIWFANGTVARASDCRKTNRDGLTQQGTVSALRGDVYEEDRNVGVDGQRKVVSTQIFPAFSIGFVEALPAYMWNIVIDDVGVKRLNKDLRLTTSGEPVLAQMINNSISTIDGVQFPDKMDTLCGHTAQNNSIETISSFSAPSLKTFNLPLNKLKTLAGTTLPDSIRSLDISNNALQDLRNIVWPRSIEDLIISGNKLPDFNWMFPCSLKSLTASNMPLKSLDGVNLPPSLERLNLANTGLTEIKANFPSTLKKLRLGGNSITAVYANASQYQILSTLNMTDKNATTCNGKLRCENIFSVTTTNATCKGHTRIEMLFGVFPICIVPDNTSSSTTLFTIVVPVVGFVLVLLAAAIACIRRRRLNTQKWYLNDTSGADTTVFTLDDQVSDLLTELFHSCRIPANKVDQDIEIGRGGYGVVYLATVRGPAKGEMRRVAMKRLLPERLHNMEYMDAFLEEIRLCASLAHPNIVEFVGVTWTKLLNVSMLMEYMGLGDVWSLVEADRAEGLLQWNVNPDVQFNLNANQPDIPLLSCGLEDPDLKLSKFSILRDIVNALVYLHELPIIHRDIKAKNVLLNETCEAKVTDFGTSRERVSDYTMTSEIGTMPWVAPEVLKGVRYSEKADIYSLGVLICELDTAQVPYANLVGTQGGDMQVTKAKIMMMVVAGDLRPVLTQSCPDIIYEITRRCVAYEPSDRPSAKELQMWLREIQGAVGVPGSSRVL